ncbi:tRNA modification GTPase MnmE [Hydrogenophilus thermoluteolus]|uniref:tRNA uridine-5-carboxymethylaminomethyl(34) synthesis GTPase MnmE n=1 Tax=Hydrogenophilus thermoluteolus TaxID=297 RepID=UPI00249FED8C|nr:tRNA uridine-5-carboxymethylaminomethyl(34) synthesis GTPase MnmE [Hydrogenophilus thermoluteolus]GLW60495.1 tRNA modification GTPase MnmE [Hydrogenophilus thermoluteolus]
MKPVSDTIAAVATPPGRGAVAIIRISGPDAHRIGCALTGKTELPPRRPVRAWLTDHDGSLLDDGLLLYFPEPNSFTGESVVEIHGHGGPVVVEAVLSRVLSLGARLARPGEFSERAFLNGKIDLAQAEAIADLIDATHRAAARAAAQGLQGAFSHAVAALDRQLTELRVWVEAAIDFVDEAIDFIAEGDVAARITAVRQALAHWLEVGRQGLLLRHGVRVAVVGAPNVGKSSLLNALVGEERAIVTEIPGTTRDVIRESIDLDGLLVHLLDTAGVRETDDPVERIGVERSWQAIAGADLILWIRAPDIDDRALAEALQERGIAPQAILEVWNKADRFPERVAETAVWISAKTGSGLDRLRATIRDRVGFRGVEESVWLARERHLEALRRADHHLAQALSMLVQWEFLAEELRLAHDALGEITGRIDADALLGVIFSQFCIGK